MEILKPNQANFGRRRLKSLVQKEKKPFLTYFTEGTSFLFCGYSARPAAKMFVKRDKRLLLVVPN